jgi:hypothetical protein
MSIRGTADPPSPGERGKRGGGGEKERRRGVYMYIYRENLTFSLYIW